MRNFSNRRLFIGFTLVWAGLIIAVALSFYTKTRLAEGSRSVQHTHEVLIGYYKLESELTRIETDSRGYVATGDEEFIEFIETSRAQVWDYFFYLQKVTQDNPTHQINLDKVRPLLERKLAFTSRLIALRRQGFGELAQKTLGSKEGKVIMDEIRRILRSSVDLQNNLLESRLKNTDTVNTRSTIFILASLFVSSFIGIITLVLYRRFSRERQRSVEGLREFNSLLEGVFESSLSGIMVMKAIRNNMGRIEDLEWVAINDKACLLLKRTSGSLIGQRLLKLSPTHAENGLFDMYRTVIETGKPVDTEQHVTLSNNEVQWLNISVAPIANGVAITFSDITPRKEDALRLEVNESNLQALINNTADEVWSVDRKLEVITANHAFREREKPAETTELWTRTLYRALGGERFRQEITVPTTEGAKRLMDYHFNPVIGSDGHITGVAVFGQDITDKRSNEARMRRQSHLLNTILKNIPIILFSIRRDGMLISIDGKGLEIYGFTSSDITGRNVLDVYPYHYEEFSNAITGIPQHFIWRSHDEDAHRYFDAYLFPDETGLAAVTGVALDITPMKRTEMELQTAKRRAETASAIKTRFLANMSHEIRTPLSAILGFAEVLRKEEQDKRHQEYLGHIESAGTTLLKLIGDILDLTKIEEGVMSLMEESFHLEEVVSSMLHPYRFRANEKGLEFNLSFVGDLPPYLIGDAGKLVQVLVNLVGNALKFTKDGGVEVEIQGFEVSDDNLLLLQASVSDSGIGIPEEKQSSVFDAFSQADDGIAREFGGSGLGLSIANEMVRLLGGHLELESPSGHPFNTKASGTRFYFTVPFRIDTERANQPDQPVHHAGEVHFEGAYKVLMVEDNPVNQQLGSLILQGCGCQIAIAANGREGIDMAMADAYDLVLMDVQMPVLDGLSATRAIRELKPELVIVGLSANVYKEDVDECFEAGMNDFLAKPYTAEKMQDMLLKYMPASATLTEKERPILAVEAPTQSIKPSLSYLHNLVGNDSEQIRSFVDAFRDVAAEFLSLFQQTDDWKQKLPELSKTAHKLKASLHLVGLDSLFGFMEQIEYSQRRGTPLPNDTVVTDTLHKLEASLTELDVMLMAL